MRTELSRNQSFLKCIGAYMLEMGSVRTGLSKTKAQREPSFTLCFFYN